MLSRQNILWSVYCAYEKDRLYWTLVQAKPHRATRRRLNRHPWPRRHAPLSWQQDYQQLCISSSVLIQLSASSRSDDRAKLMGLLQTAVARLSRTCMSVE